MIELTLEFKLESFLVNSTGDAAGLSVQSSTKALRLCCERVVSASLITDEKPTSDFDFLSTSGKIGVKAETDQAFDQQFVQYFSTHATMDISKVMVTYGDSGYRTSARDVSSGAIGRLFIGESAKKRNLEIVMVIKPDEFESIWAMTAQQNVRRIIATLVCFKLKPEDQGEQRSGFQAAGIFSSVLQLMP